MKNVKCIVCDKEIKGEYYLGEKSDMDVVLCKEHKDYCDKCQLKSCNDEEPCKLLTENS